VLDLGAQGDGGGTGLASRSAVGGNAFGLGNADRSGAAGKLRISFASFSNGPA